MAEANDRFPKQVYIAAGERASERLLSVGIGRSVVINLADEVADVLVSNPEIADAVVRTQHRVFILGNKAGQANLEDKDAFVAHGDLEAIQKKEGRICLSLAADDVLL